MEIPFLHAGGTIARGIPNTSQNFDEKTGKKISRKQNNSINQDHLSSCVKKSPKIKKEPPYQIKMVGLINPF